MTTLPTLCTLWVLWENAIIRIRLYGCQGKDAIADFKEDFPRRLVNFFFIFIFAQMLKDFITDISNGVQYTQNRTVSSSLSNTSGVKRAIRVFPI